jgi:hypothetical protein
MHRALVIVLIALFSVAALADEPGGTGPGMPPGTDATGSAATPPEAADAKKVLGDYLEQVKKKKYDAAKKLVHPKTLELIATQKKKSPNFQNPMDPAAWAKADFYLTDFTIGDPAGLPLGTIQFSVKELNYRVQEKGVDGDPETNTYLLGKSGGRWLVVDKRNNNTFDAKSVKRDYKGYFDGAADEKTADE